MAILKTGISAAAPAPPGRLLSFAALHAAPMALLGGTIACEYVFRTGQPAGWLDESQISQAFTVVIFVIRFAAFAIALGAWTWYAGAVRFEESPSLTEAILTGWTSCVRLAFAAAPLWILSLLYATFVARAARLGAFAFQPAGAWAVMLCTVFIIACALPPLLFIAAKYVLLVPLVVYERASWLPAIALSGAHMPARTMLSLWVVLLLNGTVMVVCVLLPTWCCADQFLAALGPVLSQPPWSIILQCAALGLFALGAPIACASMASLYFIVLSRTNGPATHD